MIECPACKTLLGGVDYRQGERPLVPPHEIESVVGYDRRHDGHHPMTRRTWCPMSGEPIPTGAEV